jgi:hypothetical protein
MTPARDRQLRQVETDSCNQLGCPSTLAQMQQRARRGHGPVGDGFAGERQREEFGRLQEQLRRSEHIRFVRADPEDLGGNVECRGNMSGQGVQCLGAEGVAQ